MRSWFALIFAPGIALAVQSVMYALVTPECSTQTRLWIHVSAALALLAAAVLTLLARTEWTPQPQGPDSVEGDPHTARRFLAIVAVGVSALSCLVIVAMWIGAWMLSPCSVQ